MLKVRDMEIQRRHRKPWGYAVLLWLMDNHLMSLVSIVKMRLKKSARERLAGPTVSALKG